MNIALVHDQIAEFGGAERVLISLKKAYPEADVYTAFVDRRRLGKHWEHFAGWNITESWLAKIPFYKKLYSPLRFLLPLVWRSFDLSTYDVVICSSSWGMSKGTSLSSVVRRPSSSDQTIEKLPRRTNSEGRRTYYFCYLHNPPRYLYGYDESKLKKYWFVRAYALVVNHFLRQYDYRSSQTIDYFIFNSEEIRARSLKFYRRDGIVIHPPISQIQSSNFPASGTGKIQNENKYYLTVSRLVPTKHIDLLIKAANTMKLPLRVVGVGNEYEHLKKIAGPTVELFGSVTDEELSGLYAGAKAFLYASVNEDFGMVPVEAMAHGVPVVAYASGGVLETVSDGKNGFLYTNLTAESLIEKIQSIEMLPPKEYEDMSNEALRFAQTCSEEHFIRSIRWQIEDALQTQ